MNKRVYFKPPPALEYLKNGIFRIKSKHNTLWNLDKKLRKYGVVLKTMDMDKKNNGDLYVFSDAPYPWELNWWNKVFITRDKNFLLSLESPIVNPFSHLSLVRHFFRRIYTWDDSLVDNKKYFKYFLAQSYFGLGTKKVSFRNKKFLAFVNSKKDALPLFIALSPYKKNLYRERLVSLKFFSKMIPESFDAYGMGWNKSIPWDIGERIFGVRHYAAFKGGLGEDKIKILANYKFCLCFENAVAPGYITEKIFDCFKAHCVPIYWGAPNIGDYIDKQCFIDFRKFANYKSLLSFILEMSGKRYAKYVKAIDNFLQKKTTKRDWFKDSLVEIILQNLS